MDIVVGLLTKTPVTFPFLAEEQQKLKVLFNYMYSGVIFAEMDIFLATTDAR